MLFKIPLRNIRRSLRDYAIYFFTLIIGVSVFYVFNAIGGQAATVLVDESANEIVKLLSTVLEGTSVFVAFVLAFLIIYASRFLMKRRSSEFALYMMLGMSKRRISAILLIETMMIGIGSLAVGLPVGIGISQLMSAVVTNLFEADMTNYRFSVSFDAILMTILFFAVMYVAVMIFNSAAVTRMKLIDLIQSGRKSEKVRLRNPVLCVIVFIVAAVMLGYAYKKVGWPDDTLSRERLILYICMGIVSTFLIFWSISGLILRILMSVKKLYHKGLNTFTFRQISCRVNTMVFSMTVICLMLFLTICALTSSFSIRNAMNKNATELCPADVEVTLENICIGDEIYCDDLDLFFGEAGIDPGAELKECVRYRQYNDEALTMADFFGDRYEDVKNRNNRIFYDTAENVMGIGEYNAVMRLYGKDELELGDNEYAVVCNFPQMLELRDEILADKPDLTVFGTRLKSKYDKCINGFVGLAVEYLNLGIIIVPDSVVEGQKNNSDNLVGTHGITDKAERSRVEGKIIGEVKDAINTWAVKLARENEGASIGVNLWAFGKSELLTGTVGMSAIITFLGLYIGIVFLIACGALLALKELSGAVDSITRYEMLRKIGAEEKDITFSLLKQTGIFFLMPLVLAIVHSLFGMKFATFVLESFGTEDLWKSIAVTSAVLLLIYGGYFLITFMSSKRIIKENPNKSE